MRFNVWEDDFCENSPIVACRSQETGSVEGVLERKLSSHWNPGRVDRLCPYWHSPHDLICFWLAGQNSACSLMFPGENWAVHTSLFCILKKTSCQSTGVPAEDSSQSISTWISRGWCWKIMPWSPLMEWSLCFMSRMEFQSHWPEPAAVPDQFEIGIPNFPFGGLQLPISNQHAELRWELSKRHFLKEDDNTFYLPSSEPPLVPHLSFSFLAQKFLCIFWWEQCRRIQRRHPQFLKFISETFFYGN